MARIIGINLPNKRIEIALTYLYGIGLPSSQQILDQAKVDRNKRANDLTDDEINRLRKIIEKDYIVEGDLKAAVRSAIKRMIDINCYRGMRHRKKLPVRGQRTRTNSKTRKGRSRAIANKKAVKK